MSIKGRIDKVQCEFERMLFVEKLGDKKLMRFAVHNYFIAAANCYILDECTVSQKKMIYDECKKSAEGYVEYCSFGDRIFVRAFCCMPKFIGAVLKKYRAIR